MATASGVMSGVEGDKGTPLPPQQKFGVQREEEGRPLDCFPTPSADLPTPCPFCPWRPALPGLPSPAQPWGLVGGHVSFTLIPSLV